MPYWSLYLKEIGFNALQIGELTALLVGTKVVAPNLWGWIADHTGKSLRIIRIASFFAASLFGGFLLDHTYLWFALVTVIFSFFWNAALPQFEAATLFHLKEDSHRYSRIRLWGSVGFILAVLGIGALLDVYSIMILPAVIILLLFFIWLITLFTPDVRVAHHGSDNLNIWQILKTPEVLAFLAVSTLLQMSHGPYYVFFSIYLNQNHYTTTVTGMLWALGVAAEVVLFVFMGVLLKRYTLRRILLISLLLSVCRWTLIALQIKHLWLMVFAQLLHAASFGASHIVAIHLVHRYFGSRHQGKGQALYSSASFGLGAMFGSLLSGYYWQSYGAQWVFLMAAAVSCIAFFIAFVWVGKSQKSVVMR